MMMRALIFQQKERRWLDQLSDRSHLGTNSGQDRQGCDDLEERDQM